MSSVLIVDDEKNMLVSLKAILQDDGYQIHLAQSGEEALEIFEKRSFDLMISDLKMSGVTGLELLDKARRKYPKMPVILITAYATPKSAVEAIKAGATDYISKPFDPEEIVFSVRRALEFTSIQNENLSLRENLRVQRALDEIIGGDASMMSVRQLIESIAPTSATVLIEGESGTGKELVAKAVHELSERREKAFVPVNCAAIPETLLESELFGHERGAFTGAVALKKGKFEIADEGTIYLDEIGDMSLALQAKILRVLEDGRFERVGGTASIRSRARVIAASNKDLKKAVQEGLFREDLYFRINVMSIKLPPLRERAGDIPTLIEHFIRRFNVVYGKNIRGMAPEVLKIMASYGWPGNVRELRNIVERSILLEKESFVQAQTIPLELLQSGTALDPVLGINGKIDFKTATEAYEKQLIQWALQKNENRIGASAKALGLTRHSLRHYLLKHFKGRPDLDAE